MEIKKNFISCEFCEENTATCLCFKCNNYFCDKCFKIIHNLKKDEEHKKEVLDNFIPIELKCQKHPPNLNNLFCLDEKEICCPICHFRNLHNGHKLFEISDEEALKKENFNVEKEMDNYNEISNKMSGLKDTIEKEIEEINKSYDETVESLKNYYQKKYDALLKQESDLKENLQNQVTKTKEQLEIFLSEINENIRISERINKGINKIIKEKQSMIQLLSYISKINTSKKSMRKLTSELMKTIKFSFEEEKNIINYEEIFFNGMPVPKNIEFKEITSTGFKLFWKADDIKLKNNHKNQNKYKVELKKKNNDTFKEIYQGNKTFCTVDNLGINTTYEIRICSYNKEFSGEWSEIKEITLIDSAILSETKKSKEYLDIICNWCECEDIELIYRGSKDGMTAKDFHKKCDNQGANFILIKNEKGNIFGGYSSISWTCDDGNKDAPKSFLFTLTNIFNSPPTKFPSNNNGNEVYHLKNYGPIFGKDGFDFNLQSNFLQQNSACSTFPKSFKDVLGKGKAVFTGNESGNNFSIKEIEVFKILDKKC